MQLLFKQRLFSWLDSYDIYDENGAVVFRVEGRLAWGHCLEIFDAAGRSVGKVKEEVFSFLPRFRLYIANSCIGEVRKELSFLRPRFTLDFNGWNVRGNFLEWDYTVTSGGETVMSASKQVFNWTDTYVIDVPKIEHVLYSLMIVLAIDAAKCSDGNS